jgi:hypothetical protein
MRMRIRVGVGALAVLRAAALIVALAILFYALLAFWLPAPEAAPRTRNALALDGGR